VILAPVLNPWYWLWILPLGFLLAEQDRASQIALAGSGCVLLLSYGHGLYAEQFPIRWLHSHAELYPYQLPPVLQWAQHATLWLALVWLSVRYAWASRRNG
jgi:hypothetical protein